MTIFCRDDSLREDLEIKESQEENDDNDNDYIRVVSDPETALACANSIMIKPGGNSFHTRGEGFCRMGT